MNNWANFEASDMGAGCTVSVAEGDGIDWIVTFSGDGDYSATTHIYFDGEIYISETLVTGENHHYTDNDEE